MKHLPVVILIVMVVLVAVVTGCRGEARYDARLTATDSLMATAPDSALALVEALTPDSLATEGDRAYRDLLVTQARYKCYITATSDSDINRALAYYRAHSREREKLTRAYIYKGAVMEELGHPDSAMFYYKHAEATAAPDDYFNLGYINLRIGKLYQSFYQNDSAVVARMEYAARYFSQANDTDFLITSLGTYGIYKYNEDIDTAIKYLENAISLAKLTHSSKRFKFQSKLAGFYFYRKEYTRAKDLSMDIICNGKDECSESQFYYYAARSFIKISCLDSAHYVHSLIPEPKTPLDSMNHYTLAAELANAEHRFNDYAVYLAKAKNINDNILVSSLNSNISKIEVQCDAERSNTQYRQHIKNHALIRSTIVIFAMLLMTFFFTRVFLKKRITSYQRDIEASRRELEETINQLQQTITEYETAITKQEELLNAQERDIKKIHQEKDKLYSQQTAVKEQVAAIVRHRLSALNELYQDIRVRSTSKHAAHSKSLLPLLSLIKEMNDKRQLSIIKPKESFRRELKSSIDDEYQGIATFLQNRYPTLTIKDHHLFWLLCARISPQIIKLCMNYSNAVTVSNYKRKLIKEKLGLDISFDDFIQLYLDGQFK